MGTINDGPGQVWKQRTPGSVPSVCYGITDIWWSESHTRQDKETRPGPGPPPPLALHHHVSSWPVASLVYTPRSIEDYLFIDHIVRARCHYALVYYNRWGDDACPTHHRDACSRVIEESVGGQSHLRYGITNLRFDSSSSNSSYRPC